MSKKPSGSGAPPANLPDGFFDSDKKSKKEQEDDLAKEMEQFEREMAALQEESEEQLNEEFAKLQDEKNLDELDGQIDQWKRVIELEKRAEELKNKPLTGSPVKKFKSDGEKVTSRHDDNSSKAIDENLDNLDDIEDFEDKLSNWRSKGL